MTPPPRGWIAHLGHAILRTPDLEASTWFFTELLGMTVTVATDESVHLRAWDDYEETTLVLTRAERAGLQRVAYRAASQEALDTVVAAVSRTGRPGAWQDGVAGTGPTFVTADPDGHEIAVYYETHWYQAPTHLRPGLKNQAQAKPDRAVAVRRLDHVNFLAADVMENARFTEDVLGARATEQIQLDGGRVSARWLTFTDKSYDVVYTEDWTGGGGRLHHLAFATDTREEILRAADLSLDLGVPIETGPHKHAIQQTFFLYLFEPGGNRIELCNPLTRLVLAPDWRLVTWTAEERARGQAWGLRTIESFHTHGTPPETGGEHVGRYRPARMLAQDGVRP